MEKSCQKAFGKQKPQKCQTVQRNSNTLIGNFANRSRKALNEHIVSNTVNLKKLKF